MGPEVGTCAVDDCLMHNIYIVSNETKDGWQKEKIELTKGDEISVQVAKNYLGDEYWTSDDK